MDNIKETYYHIYCPLCEHQSVPEDKYPCHECLNEPYRIDSHKPAYFKEKYEVKDAEDLNGRKYRVLKKKEERIV